MYNSNYRPIYTYINCTLVQALCWTHGALNVKRPDILPMLLQKRNQKVDGQMDVVNQLVLGHVCVSDGNIETQYL